jgi:predicted NodU family carbamoyl transferase
MDAISTFGRSNMDALVLEDLVVGRNDIPAC